MKPIIYLAGPITGLSYADTVGWRDDMIAQHGDEFNFASPMRAKNHLKDVGSIVDTYPSNPLSTGQAIMARDSWDVNRCDAVFVNLTSADRVSIGTVMECAWAWQIKTPIIAVMEKDNIHQHCMMNEAIPFKAETLDEGIDLLYALFSLNT